MTNTPIRDAALRMCNSHYGRLSAPLPIGKTEFYAQAMGVIPETRADFGPITVRLMLVETGDISGAPYNLGLGFGPWGLI